MPPDALVDALAPPAVAADAAFDCRPFVDVDPPAFALPPDEDVADVPPEDALPADLPVPDFALDDAALDPLPDAFDPPPADFVPVEDPVGAVCVPPEADMPDVAGVPDAELGIARGASCTGRSGVTSALVFGASSALREGFLVCDWLGIDPTRRAMVDI